VGKGLMRSAAVKGVASGDGKAESLESDDSAGSRRFKATPTALPMVVAVSISIIDPADVGSVFRSTCKLSWYP
jgi:hypothetical protein